MEKRWSGDIEQVSLHVILTKEIDRYKRELLVINLLQLASVTISNPLQVNLAASGNGEIELSAMATTAFDEPQSEPESETDKDLTKSAPPAYSAAHSYVTISDTDVKPPPPPQSPSFIETLVLPARETQC